METVSEPVLRLEHVGKRFAKLGDAPANHVLRDLSFDLPAGQRLALIGPSGCGKSTLLNMIAGLEPVSVGRIQRDPLQKLAFVFQEPRLLPWRSVADNLRLVMENPDPATVAHWLDAVGLAQSGDVFASRLSLGMARRAAIARAFIINPQLLVMDEPFVSLDAAAAQKLQSLLLGLLEEQKTSLLFVTHDLREAIRICDRLMFLSPAPSQCLFEYRINLAPKERLNERMVDAVREEIIEIYGIDTGQLAVTKGLHDG